jgi:hypothetical protein
LGYSIKEIIMAARDFMPFIVGSGGPRVRYGRLNASETFREGEVVYINNDGEVAEGPADDSVLLIADLDSGVLGGVAAMDGDTTRTDGFARSTGALVSYYPWNDGTLFITKKYVSAADTVAIPPGTIVGESFQVHGSNATVLTANWEILSTAGVPGTDICAEIHQVLNSRMEPILATDTTTGVWVVFELYAREVNA